MFNNRAKNDIKDYTAKDLMTKDVVTLLPHDNLLDAQNKMSRYGIRKIVIVDDNNKRLPVGILSIKGIIKFLILDRIDRDLDEIPIDEAMTKKLITISEKKESSIALKSWIKILTVL
jgi:CBS domain-containing protein